MNKHNMKYIIGLILGIIGLFILSIIIILICKKLFIAKVNENDVFISSNIYEVTIEDKLSVSDEFGKNIKEDNNHAFGYFEFDVFNNIDSNRNYEIYITEKDNESEINPSYVKFYLTDDHDNFLNILNSTKIPVYSDLKYLEDKPSSKLLYSGSLKANETKKYKLRVWLSDSYVIENSNRSFIFEIGVRAV